MLLTIHPNDKDHILGNLNAPVSLIQYGDYEDTICSRTEPDIKKILQEFKGSVCYVFRHFPLTFVHPHSALAAVAAEVAAEDGKFWEMHEKLLMNHTKLDVEHILKMAQDLGFDKNIFFHDLEGAAPMEEVITDMISGQDSGVETSPTFFVNGMKIFGIVNYESLRTDIQHFLPEPRVHY